MSSPFIGEIRAVGYSFAPKGWATCDGQLLSISQNTALFSLLGVNFGGNGSSNFGLPNFQGRAPISQGQGSGLSSYSVGDSGGAQSVTITQQTMPAHDHNPFYGDEEPAGDNDPDGDLYAGASASTYGPLGTQTFAAGTVGTVGNGQPHDNMAPHVAVLFVIALTGIYPARS